MSHRISEKCIGCTACARLCPVFAIEGTKGERHVINANRCVDCGVCGRLCPQEGVYDAKDNICKKIPRTLWAKPIVDEEKCSGCGVCVNICSAGVLGISKPTFRGDIDVHAEIINEKKCVFCRLCEEECPLSAIEFVEVQEEEDKKNLPSKKEGLK